jgi:hypothetical protein
VYGVQHEGVLGLAVSKRAANQAGWEHATVFLSSILVLHVSRSVAGASLAVKQQGGTASSVARAQQFVRQRESGVVREKTGDDLRQRFSMSHLAVPFCFNEDLK